jgi:hypothetical protein
MEIEITVEQVPVAVEAALKGDLIIPIPGQPAFEVDPHPGNVEAALAEGTTVGGEELEVGLVEHVEPEVKPFILGRDLKPVGEPGLQGQLAGGGGPAHLARTAEVRAAGGRLACLWRPFSLSALARLTQPTLKLAVTILQFIVAPIRLLAVALDLLEQAGVYLFDSLEPLVERCCPGWVLLRCRWLAVRHAAGPVPGSQGGEPGAERSADPKMGDRLAHPALSSETGRRISPHGSVRLIRDRHAGRLIVNENGDFIFS